MQLLTLALLALEENSQAAAWGAEFVAIARAQPYLASPPVPYGNSLTTKTPWGFPGSFGL